MKLKVWMNETECLCERRNCKEWQRLHWASRISPTTSPAGPRPQGLCTGCCLLQEPRLCLTCSLSPEGLGSDVPISGRASLPIAFNHPFSNLLLNLFPWFIFLQRMLCLVIQLCLTLCDSMDYNPPGSSVHEIFQARILELPFPPPGYVPDPGIEPTSSVSPALQTDSLPTEPLGNLSIEYFTICLASTCSKELACQWRRCKRHSFHPWVRKIPWRREWQPTPVFLPGESHGQRSPAHRVKKSRTWWKQLSMH